MLEGPTKYARSGDVHIAYRIFGDGPRDIVLIPGTISHIELLWEVPSNEHLLKRLTAFARVIVFDKRGQGLSDRVAEQTLEERVGDVRAVMDAASSERATIYGWSEGGPMCLMFAATYPARTSTLVLYGTFASMKNEPWMVTREAFDKTLAWLVEHWGGRHLGANQCAEPARRPSVLAMVCQNRACVGESRVRPGVNDSELRNRRSSSAADDSSADADTASRRR